MPAKLGSFCYSCSDDNTENVGGGSGEGEQGNRTGNSFVLTNWEHWQDLKGFTDQDGYPFHSKAPSCIIAHCSIVI